MRILTCLLVSAALVAADPALAGNKNKANGKGNQPASAGEILTNAVVGGLITAAERAIIGDYLDHNRGAFADVQALPPGIARKVARGGALPPGIAKKTLPGGLLAQLPPRPGQEWRVVGADVLIVEVATGVIVDVLKGAIRG